MTAGSPPLRDDGGERTERCHRLRSPHAVFAWCPMCEGRVVPEHAHYRCQDCGWRDSCCD